MKTFEIIKVNPLHWIALTALIFDVYFIIMKRLPGVGSIPACTIGGSLTVENIFFSLILSGLTAFNILGLIKLYKVRSKAVSKKGTSSLAGLGFIIGFFTVFCALCTIPVISVFGLAIGLGFFTTYNLYFKIVSLLLMAGSLYLLNKQLENHCACNLKQ